MLLDDLKKAIRMRHYSRRTEEAYTAWVKQYILFQILNGDGSGFCRLPRVI